MTKRLAKLKRLATKEDFIIQVLSPLSMSEIGDRTKDYDVLTPKQFGTKYKDLLFTPIELTWNGNTHQIQYHHCSHHGLHVGSTYTTIAHLWLIKRFVKAPEWHFVTDENNFLLYIHQPSILKRNTAI